MLSCSLLLLAAALVQHSSHAFISITRALVPKQHALAATKTAVVAGATGYIGKSVVRESVRQGYRTIALVRDKSKIKSDDENLQNAEILECDVTDPASLEETFRTIGSVDALISCLASRSGVKKDAYLIDYQATLNFLQAGSSNSQPLPHFVLLSAFCVKNPWLQFQQAKLKFEAQLTEQSKIPYTIVRPTAFFKSVSGQLEVVQSGGPFVMFGEGTTKCNPISEADLATYLVDSITEPSRRNKIINLGGPDTEGLTMKQQGDMLFEITGQEPSFVRAPIWLFDAIINSLQFLANVTGSQALEDAAETGRIGKYYAVEDMYTTEETFGTMRLKEHYERINEFGQEYDPYTTMFARARGVDVERMREEKVNATAVSS